MEKMNAEKMAVGENASPVEEIQAWREQLVRGALRALVSIGLLAIVAGSYESYVNQKLWVIPFYWALYIIGVLITFWRRSPYVLRAAVLLGALYGLAILNFLTGGLGNSSRMYLLSITAAAGLFFGWRESIFALGFAFLTMVGFGWGFCTGRITGYEEIISTDPALWAGITFELVMLCAFLVVSLNHMLPRFKTALVQGRELSRELETHRVGLKDQVADLARRSMHLETAARVARDAAAIRDVEQLLEETTHLISDRFGFYHTGIFLLDEAKEYAVLRAASSEGGQRMLAQGHRLRVGEVGIVGYVTSRGEPRITLDVGADAVYFDNHDLPDTRSEMALPLQARGEIIGALDVQSREPQAFTKEDVATLQTLADQIAVAISNTRLFQQAQESLEAERRAYGELSLRAWRELLHARPDLSQRYDPHGILPPDGRWRKEMKLAVRQGETVLGEDGPSATLVTPIKVRNQVIGVLDAHKPTGAGEWTQEEISLLETITEQLGMALESARLYEDAQRHAARERLTGEITGRMRASLDLESVLKTAADEMYQSLGLDEIVIRLATQEGGNGATLESHSPAADGPGTRTPREEVV